MTKVYCLFIVSMTPNIRVETIKNGFINSGIGHVEAVYFTYDERRNNTKSAFVYFTLNGMRCPAVILEKKEEEIVEIFPYSENRYIFWEGIVAKNPPIPCERFEIKILEERIENLEGELDRAYENLQKLTAAFAVERNVNRDTLKDIRQIKIVINRLIERDFEIQKKLRTYGIGI